MYTASDAFFDSLIQFGISYCFVNLGSDHPSIIEAITKGQKDTSRKFPTIITCPNEMVALSMADGYARYTGRPQCVIVHVDVGTQGLGAAVHNASCGRAPVLIFAGLSPYTCEGELRGSRTEYIHWIQDVPDQRQIVAQYCRYTGEIKRGVNVKQMVGRALQFAMSAPMGPVYLMGSREAMEEVIEEYALNVEHWGPVGPAALPESAVRTIAEALVYAEEPLLITGYSGRNFAAVGELVKLADTIPGLRVLDTGGSDMCFPSSHIASVGLRYGVDDSIRTADVILMLDVDVPWIPTQCPPLDAAKVFHLDCDPLKQQMPVAYYPALLRYKTDACTALSQLTTHITATPSLTNHISSTAASRTERLHTLHSTRMTKIRALAPPNPPPSSPLTTPHLIATLRSLVPPTTIFAIEAVTATALVADQILPTLPGTWLNCGGGGLGWSGGAALGIKFAAGPDAFVCQIVGDGTFLFSVPGSVYWIAARYKIPVLTIVLNNKGWNAPRRSLLLVHPEGEGAKASNAELNIALDGPSPDYAGIAVAAAGGEGSGRVWGGRAGTVGELRGVLGEAVERVRGGVGAVVDVRVDAWRDVEGGKREEEGKFPGEKAVLVG
ncbi:hypothetical protein MMC21_006308 [Puttea exsequens]|nr:hypothetical protein [Puttea exsequens]